MGCSCSKAITRSISIREELSNTFQNASAAWEELFVSRNGNDHLFAFLSSGNPTSVSNKHQTDGVALPPSDDLEEKYFVNALDFISDLERKTGVDSTPGFDEELELARFTRSRGHQMQREKETVRMDQSKLDWRDKNQRGSRSFHTVEEYDALMERIHKSRTSTVSHPQPDSMESVADQSDARDGSCYILAKEFEEEARVLGNLLPDDAIFNAVSFRRDEHELGWKRKAAAKALKSLDVPTIEFPAIAKFKQKVQAEGQVYSPGTYVTPKFGSYNKKKASRRERGGIDEGSPLCPELLAAFEDCLHQIEVEETDTIRAMDGEK